jgi:DnaJ-class molecular chaperone
MWTPYHDVTEAKHYKVLGFRLRATSLESKRTYRDERLDCHLDKTREAGQEAMAAVNNARDVLQGKDRLDYDYDHDIQKQDPAL